MINKVIKRDGRVVDFDSSKILAAVEKSMKAAGQAAPQGAAAVTEAVVRYLEAHYPDTPPKIEEIQDVVEHELMRMGFDEVAKQYILYRANRTRIREANTSLMKTIDEITRVDARQSDVKRDNANIDGNTAMGSMLQIGTAGAKAYNEAYLLTPAQAKAYREGDIHIHDFDFYSLTTTCTQIDIINLFDGGFSTGHGFLREPQSIQSYAALAAIAIQSNQNDQHGGQSVPKFDFDMAPGVAKTYRRSYRRNLAKACELLCPLQADSDGLTTVLDRTFAQLEQDGLLPSLEDSQAYTLAERRLLTEQLGCPDESVESAQRFAQKYSYEETERATYHAMESLILDLNTMHSRAGAQTPFSSLNYGTDTSPEGRMVIRSLLLAEQSGLGHGETPIFPIHIFKVKEGVNYRPEDPNYDLFCLACQVSAKRLFPNFSFLDAPYNLQYYRSGHPETEVAYMGCRTRVAANVYDPTREITTGRGNLSYTSINLPRLGLLANKNLDLFFELLDQKIDLVIQQLLDRFRIQGQKKVINFPFLMGQGVWLDSETLGPEDEVGQVLRHGTLTIGFIGLAETLVALIGQHHGQSEYAQNLGLEIIGHMRARMDAASEQMKLNFSLIATPAEGLSGRFVKIDRQRFGVIPGITDRDYYTNSFHIPVYYDINAFEKIRLEAPYHALTNGGHITYVELDGDPCQNTEAFMQLICCMKEAGIGYGSINHPVDRDPVCGFNGIIGDTCPRCGRREGEGVPLSKLQKLGLYKNYNSTTIGYHGDPAEEADRQPNTLKIVKK